MVDEFCRAAEFVPTPGGTPLHLVATFQRGVRERDREIERLKNINCHFYYAQSLYEILFWFCTVGCEGLIHLFSL